MHQRFPKVTRAAAVVPAQAIPRCLQPLPHHQYRVQIAKTLIVLTVIQTLQAIQVLKLYFHTAATLNQANRIFLPKDITMKLQVGVFPFSMHKVSTSIPIGDTHAPYLALCDAKGIARKALQATVVALHLSCM